MISKCMHVTTPQILWHGGSICEGKPDPVYSVDFHPTENVLITTGFDASIPARGSVRLWKIDVDQEKEDFLVEFNDHSSVLNIARFSPCGTMIATASHKQILVYRVLEPYKWSEVTDIQEARQNNLRQIEVKRFSPSLEDIVDLEWSPDSTYIIIGALEQKSEIIRIASKDKQRDNSLILPSHGGYVQGVAWDPYNQAVVTQSADRSVKVHKIAFRENMMVKLSSSGHSTIKMYANESPDKKEESDWQSLDAPGAETTVKKRTVGVNLFADSNVPSSFRRLSFSPDGSLLIVPAGVHRSVSNKSSAAGGSNNGGTNNAPMTFCTHLFLRNHYQYPALSLVGLEDPSVAVRCCPRLFKLLETSSSSSSSQEAGASPVSLFRGNYRMIFAVATMSSVFLYDTQHPYPLAKFRRLHFAPINDCAWSSDGRVLAVCSSDGYLSFVRFKEGALGELLDNDQVPEIVKISHPALYNYRPQQPQKSDPSASTVTVSEETAKETEQTEERDSKAPISRENDQNLGNLPHSSSNSSSNSMIGDSKTVAEEEEEGEDRAGKKRKRIVPEKIEESSLDTLVAHPSFSPEKKQKSSSSAETAEAAATAEVVPIDLSED